jgi:DNA ligase-associated metallophosphoesterase
MTITKNIAGQTLVLHPSGAIFWQERQLLLIADVHIGKVSHFRKAGIAVPYNAVVKNFIVLDAMLDLFRPRQVCFLGDLFHSESNNEWLLFENWVQRSGRSILLIAGNHDILSPDRYAALGIAVVKEWTTGNLLLTHHPTIRDGLFNVCGHIHPAITLQGQAKQFLTLPCFFHRPKQLILPAFGHFTGLYVMKPQHDDCVYAIAGNQVLTVCEN